MTTIAATLWMVFCLIFGAFFTGRAYEVKRRRLRTKRDTEWLQAANAAQMQAVAMRVRQR